MSGLPDKDYLQVIANGDCRFAGDIRWLRVVARTISMVDAGHWAGASLDGDESSIEISGETWEGVTCFGSYLLLQNRGDRRAYMLTAPGSDRDHHCRTITFAQTPERAQDDEGPLDERELLQHATAIQFMLAASI